jgi:hypothetical protein
MSMARPKSEAHSHLKAALKALPEVSCKRMFGADAYFIRQRMFAFLMEEVIVLKLPEGERQQVIGARIARPFLTGEDVPFGRWVELAIQGGEQREQAIRLAGLAYATAQAPDKEGPRRRRPAAKRRKLPKKTASS